MRIPLLLVVALVLGLVVSACGGGSDANEELPQLASDDPGPIHVHGLGVDPADDSLFIATHTGLYRLAPRESRARRVGDSYQDTMGFTVVGPRRFLGSGHPAIDEAQEQGLPPLLGLVESRDAGRSWQPVSLLGEADFHVLRFARGRIYGFDTATGRLKVSRDGGTSWTDRRPPGAVIDLAVDPTDARRLVASTPEGLYESRDAGARWTRVAEAAGLLAWPDRRGLYLVTRGGLVFRSAKAGRDLRHVGEVGGEPAALLGKGPRELYVALHDGTIERSTDGGVTWSVRSRP